jgi:large subunit ribosomal protein L23
MLSVYDVIERPVITEKALGVNAQRRYVFYVNPQANKIQIREAVQKLFTTPEGQPVTVTAVNTMTVHGKSKRFRAFGRVSSGRTSDRKKAVVTLAEGQSITIFEGV